MIEKYFNDLVMYSLIENEVVLGRIYKIGSRGEYVYFLKIDNYMSIDKVKIDDYVYEIFENETCGEIELEELIDLFEYNVAICIKENRYFDAQFYDYERLILDEYDVIVGFKAEEEED